MSIYKKLFKLQEAVKGLAKDKQAFGYKYVTGTKILSVIKPLMEQQQLLLKQEIVSIENTRQDYNTKNGLKSEILSSVMMKFTWVDTETGDTDVNSFGANGQNGFDKGVGSALTYAERYFLLKYFHIATDEDDIDNPERKTDEPIQVETVVKKEEPKDTDRKPAFKAGGWDYLMSNEATQEHIQHAIDTNRMTPQEKETLLSKIK